MTTARPRAGLSGPGRAGRLRNIAAGIAAGLALWLAPAAAQARCVPGQVQFRTDSGIVTFHVSLARTPAERERGLMNRRHLPRDAGMLFLFGKPGPVSFWMHDTLIPLDMIFMDQSGRVTRIHANATPLSDMPINGGSRVFAVLEINGGMAARADIRPGTVMRADTMPQKRAAWRCARR
ncbi:hypothetical protein U879_01905 [Defluviimonas sp. 20V17]|uniref:DUF192 domain-containing protein n=1 Tax=Allgaiera indica TaxID=765699 RepID=A0AAN5A1D7_9RHOB|nr:DUF192 domain-containing protein [Allgaiera indica]KDB05372.1 hypothetical protein U879_01905 [Defluviimonas sp. 20V17]GHE04192.1 hypothetical protein GCM10008024_30450 [Allgaiera indica]SDX50874.1 hypothetical protein SAMN05444006_11863 [Allgaiera indica]